LKDEQSGRFYSLNGLQDEFFETSRWRHIEDFRQTSVFENSQVTFCVAW